jgi:hypothetical protein
MRTRPFYFLACMLAMIAVIIVGVSKQYVGRTARAAAMAAQSQSSEEQEALHSAAQVYANQSDRLSIAAHVVFLLATGAWVCSLWRRDRGLQSIPLVLLAVVVLLDLLTV